MMQILPPKNRLIFSALILFLFNSCWSKQEPLLLFGKNSKGQILIVGLEFSREFQVDSVLVVDSSGTTVHRHVTPFKTLKHEPVYDVYGFQFNEGSVYCFDVFSKQKKFHSCSKALVFKPKD
jgi:hypothetical protein